MPQFVPLVDWEDADHAISAISAGVSLLLDVYRALKGEGNEEKDDEERSSEPQVGVVGPDGKVAAVSLSEFLANHEERLRALEAPKAAEPAPAEEPRRRRRSRKA